MLVQTSNITILLFSLFYPICAVFHNSSCSDEECQIESLARAVAVTDFPLFSCNIEEVARNEAKYIVELARDTPEVMELHFVETARRRYEKNWIPLQIKYKRSYSFMIPPIDVAFVWHTHRLRPPAYMYDLRKTFNISVLWHDFQSSPALRSIMEAYTAGIWNKNYPDEKYDPKKIQCTAEDKDFKSSFHYNLVDATRRRKSGTFHLLEDAELFLAYDEYLKDSVLAYKMWLKLRKIQNEILAPSGFIDVVWHGHQDLPQAYFGDCNKYIGYALGHNDDDDELKGTEAAKEREEELQNAGNTMYELWYDTYGDLDLFQSLMEYRLE